MEIPLLEKDNKDPNSIQPEPSLNKRVPLKVSTTEDDLKSFPSTREETSYSSVIEKSKSLLKENIGAGVTVGLVNLPLSISLAVAGGATPQAGVVTAVISGICSGIIGGSHYNVVGPTGALAGFLLSANLYFSTTYGVNCLPMISIFSGIIIIIAVLGKMQKMIDFVPDSVNEGFTLGVSMILTLGQLNNLLGLNLPKSHNVLEGAYQTLHNLKDVNIYSFIIGGIFLIGLLVLVKKYPRIPWIAFFTVFGIALGAGWNNILPGSPLPILNDRFPNLTFNNYFSEFTLPFEILADSQFYVDLIPIAFVSILETLISAKIADVATNTKFNPKQEVISLGISNCIGGLVGGIPSTAALARTRLNILSGCTHKTSSFINGITMILVTFLLFSFFKYLPLCVIASSVIYVAMRMVDFHELLIIYKAERDQFLIALLVAILSLLLDSTFGVLIGMFVFLILFFGKFLQPQSDILLPRDASLHEDDYFNRENVSSHEGHGVKRNSRHFSVTITKDQGKLRLHNMISHESIVPMLEEETGGLYKNNEIIHDEQHFCLYKFMGVVNFLNIENHINNIQHISRFKNIILSFRYCVSFDTVALHSLEKAFNDLIKKGRIVFLAFVSPQLLEKINIVCGHEWVEQLKNHNKIFVFNEN